MTAGVILLPLCHNEPPLNYHRNTREGSVGALLCAFLLSGFQAAVLKKEERKTKKNVLLLKCAKKKKTEAI